MSKGSEQTFFQGRHTEGQQTHEKMLSITNHQGNSNQTTMRDYITSVRLAIIKKRRNSKCQQACGEKEILVHCWCEWKLVQLLWKTGWRFLKKLKIELPRSSKSAAGYISQRIEGRISIVPAPCSQRHSLFIIAKKWTNE